ncbi:MAG TPA: LLM class flavin-dependent oxidoreductase [Actinomycetota bacterium]|nr:LLM class flavin-dependent oxidoreductase [Actinomycetota bacterium]
MRYAVNVPNVGDLDGLLDLAVAAEGSGWDGFFVWDQMGFMKGVPVTVFDPWVALAVVAERTDRMRIGTMITPLARRRPWKLARETVTLDHLSGGRVTLGVGLGYPPDADFELLGEDANPAVRAARLDEGLEILTGLWSGEPVDFDGEHYHVHETRFLPTPVQRPRIPIWVGGGWPSKAPFRRAARWDGVYPLGLDAGGELVPLQADAYPAMLDYVRRHRTDPFPLDVVASGAADGDPGVVAPFAEVGATWWIETDDGTPGWEERMVDRVRAGPPA